MRNEAHLPFPCFYSQVSSTTYDFSCTKARVFMNDKTGTELVIDMLNSGKNMCAQ